MRIRGIPILALTLCLAGCQTPKADRPIAKTTSSPSLPEAGVLKGHEDAVNALAFTADGKYIVSAGYGDLTVRTWDVANRRSVHSAPTKHRVRSLVISRSGAAVITGDVYGFVGFWSLEKGRLTLENSVSNGSKPIQAMALSPDGRTLAVGSFDRTVTLWDSAQRPTSRFETEPGGSSALAFSPSGAEIVTGGRGAVFAVRDLSGRALRALAVSKINANSEITAVAYSSDGRHFATAHNESTHTIWNPKTWKETVNGFVPNAGTMAAAFSPDGRVLATAQHGSGVHLWDSETGKQIALLKKHTEPVESLAFSPDGKFLASGSRDKTIRLWAVTLPTESARNP